jgi:membrane-bound lytic murein transglycosylase F
MRKEISSCVNIKTISIFLSNFPLHQLWQEMKRLFYLSFIFVFLVACSADKEQINELAELETNELIPPVDLDLDEIIARGYINAAVDYSSTTYFVYRGEIMGFEYDLLRRLEDYFKIRVNITVQPSIEETIKLLNKGEVDIIAYPLTINKERKKIIAFTDHYITQTQVLVQRKPDNWRDMKLHEIEKTLLRDQVDLIGKDVHVLNHSSYIGALESLSEQVGGDINIIEDDASIDTEQLIKNVAEGVYDYTISDENIAYVNESYYPILDIETPVSFPRRIAWAVRQNAPELRDTLNFGLRLLEKQGMINILYAKYFKSSRKAKKIADSDYSSFSGGDLSPYDELIKENAKRINWDWRLLAAMVYQESKFDPGTTSWAGAKGLLQMMPATAKEQGVSDRASPSQSLKGGTDYILWLEKQWQSRIEDHEEQLKFVMASYNVGLGHVYDACALTEKAGGDPKLWADVRLSLLKLSNRKYYSDPVVKLGYARGSEPVNYVDEILERHDRYKQLIPN